MLHVALWEPEIPPNTGNIGRLCAASDTRLHLIGRLGFRLDDRHLKRAGCDYWPHVDVQFHATFGDFEAALATHRVIPLTSHATRLYTHVRYRDGDCLLFGSESKGLPDSLLERYAAEAVTIPMPTGKVRCLNLATAVGIVLYEALRQRHDW
ncbi:MAG: tRNA (cytidine(34)-2'-O)-methyltransferase [Gemmataceae bacterium]